MINFELGINSTAFLKRCLYLGYFIPFFCFEFGSFFLAYSQLFQSLSGFTFFLMFQKPLLYCSEVVGMHIWGILCNSEFFCFFFRKEPLGSFLVQTLSSTSCIKIQVKYIRVGYTKHFQSKVIFQKQCTMYWLYPVHKYL